MKTLKSVLIVILSVSLTISCSEEVKSDSSKMADFMCEYGELSKELNKALESGDDISKLSEKANINEDSITALNKRLEEEFKDNPKGLLELRIEILKELIENCDGAEFRIQDNWSTQLAKYETELESYK